VADVNLVAILAQETGTTRSVVASDSPIVFVLDTDEVGADVQAAHSLTVSGTVTVGDTLTVKGIVLTAADDPGDGQFLASTSPLSPTASRIAESIRQAMMAQQTLTARYIIISAGASVYLTALQPGSASDITLSETGTGITLGTSTAGQDRYLGQEYPDYAIYAEVWVGAAQPFLYTGLAISSGAIYRDTLVKPYNTTGNAAAARNLHVLDLQAIAGPYTTSTPPDLSTTLQQQQDALTMCFIVYGQQYTPASMTNPQRVSVGTSDVFWILRASVEALADNNMVAYYRRTITQLLLTQQPNSRYSRLGERNLAYFLWYPPSGATWYVALRVQCVHYDGTTTDAGYHGVSVASPGLMGLRCDPDAWGLEAIEASTGKLVEYYSVNLWESLNPSMSSPSQRSDSTIFLIDRKPTISAMNLIWREPIGGYVGFQFIGQQQEGRDRAVGLHSQTLPAYQPAFSARQLGQTVTQTLTYEVESGAVNRETFDWLVLTLTRTTDAYLVNDDDTLTAITITEAPVQVDRSAPLAGIRIRIRLAVPQSVTA
jgi:hypothetical protein